MSEKILACDNENCKMKNECQRYKLYKDGEKKYKTHGGTKEKGCGKFIQL